MSKSPEKFLTGVAVAELTQEERRVDAASVVARLELTERTLPLQTVTAALRELIDEEVLVEWHGEYSFRFPLVGLYVAALEQDEAR